jgi:hypothetical protein
MFWIGVVISVIAGLLGVPLWRNWLQSKLRHATDLAFDITRTALFIVGAMIAVSGYIERGRENETLERSLKNAQGSLHSSQQEVRELKLQAMLPFLGDKALNHDDREAFDQIIHIAQTAPENSALKNSAIGEVRRFVSQVDDGRFISKSLSGSPLNDIKIPTDQIIVSLSNSDSEVRAKAARILGGRREKGVPNCLLQVFRTDKHLRVAYYAFLSFGYITRQVVRPIAAGRAPIGLSQLIEMFDIEN